MLAFSHCLVCGLTIQADVHTTGGKVSRYPHLECGCQRIPGIKTAEYGVVH